MVRRLGTLPMSIHHWKRLRKNFKTPSFRTFHRLYEQLLLDAGLRETEALKVRKQTDLAIEQARQTAASEFHAALTALLASNERLAFPHHDAPDMSIVILLLNQAHLSLACLQALLAEAQSGQAPSFEIVLVDNGSSDDTAELLRRLDGVRVLRNAHNFGFPRGCNQGARIARGRTLCLLNNDAVVRPGALRAALATLDRDPSIGAVGGRLIFPGGILQEAGCMVMSNGTTLGYGRGWAPERGEAMFRRDTDFCSGAFLVSALETWTALDGLDEAYSPAYYEDTDYCLRLWARGLRVVYEPDAVADHYERGSEARPGDAHALSVRNRKWFRARHARALRQWHYPAHNANAAMARIHRRSQRRSLLVIDNEVPLPALGQGHPRAHQLLHAALELGWAVSFFSMHHADIDWAKFRADISKDIELIADRTHAGLADFLAERRDCFDVILVSRPDNFRQFRDTLASAPHLIEGVRIVYDAEALFAKRNIARASLDGAALPHDAAEAMIDREISLTAGADAVVCVSEDEAAEFRRRVEVPVHRLSHAIAARRDTPDFPSRSGFVFVGRLLEREAPNFQGLAWFVREIWPLIHRQLPRATLSVAGHLCAEHADLTGRGIRLLGPVADLAPLYDSVRVFIAPIRFAAGVPIKILEASAAGLPTAATVLMAQQLGWHHAQQIMAADDPVALAQGCIALHQDAATWTAMRAEAQRISEQEHGPADFRQSLVKILEHPAPSSRDDVYSAPQDHEPRPATTPGAQRGV